MNRNDKILIGAIERFIKKLENAKSQLQSGNYDKYEILDVICDTGHDDYGALSMMASDWFREADLHFKAVPDTEE